MLKREPLGFVVFNHDQSKLPASNAHSAFDEFVLNRMSPLRARLGWSPRGLQLSVLSGAHLQKDSGEAIDGVVGR